jgi:hypothetical protein
VAEIEWKGVLWKAAYGELSVRDLLTVLKGYGPMEILDFDKPGACKGRVSLCLSEENTREITIHELEVLGGKRKGQGRETLRWLKSIFKGEVYVEYPDLSAEEEESGGSLLFWVKMYREGLVDGLECGGFCLYPDMGEEQLGQIEKTLRRLSRADEASPGGNEGQRQDQKH